MKTLRQKWEEFFGIVLSPWFMVFMGVTVVCLLFSVSQKENIALSNLLAILGSITGGIAGGIFQSENEKKSGQNLLEKKGRSALRNLEAIEKQLVKICQWVCEFKASKIGKEGKKTLSEIERHISTIQLNISAGLEDWVDIVPELRQRIEFVKRQEEYVRTIVEELLGKKKELLSSEDDEKRKILEQKISTLEQQLKDLQKKADREITPFFTAVSGVPYSSAFAESSILNRPFAISNARCTKCGKNIALSDYLSVGSIYDGLYCLDCRKVVDRVT